MKSNKIVLGFTGLMVSGKGTAAKYLEEKHGASTFRYSTILRDILDRIYVEQSRDNLVKISEGVRGIFGENTLAKAIAVDAQAASTDLVVVEGIRRLADIEYLKKLPNFILVEIFADPKVRHARLILRGENTDDTTKTYEQFLSDHQRSTEITIPDVVKLATERVDNNGTLEELHAALDALVGRYR
ncbi:MAG: AAA family ATPase [Patescibacteria group bacterium]